MPPEVSIIQVDKRPYRTIARENWGLTKEQMRGMHVHHRIPVSKGGTNDPSNLYVCSPKFHADVWHNGDEFTKWANEGGREGGKKTAELGVGIHAPGMASKGGEIGGTKTVELGLGIHAPGMQSKGGTKTVELGVGAHAPGMASKGGIKAAELSLGAHAPGVRSNAAKTTNSQKWVCLDTGHISNSGGLSRWQNARGIDTSLRKRVV